MAKKRSNFERNKPALIKLLEELNLPYEELSKYHFRIMGATHIVDIWPSRMVYHLHAGETIKANEPWYHGELDFEFNKEQVKRLLESGNI